MTVVDEPNGASRDPRELGGRESLEACPLLAPEPTADEFRPHADVVLPEAERAGELVAGREHALGRDPRCEVIPVPRRHCAVRLEGRLQVCRGLERQLDRHLGGRESSLGVAAGIVGWVGRELLLA